MGPHMTQMALGDVFVATHTWRRAFPGAVAGLLVMRDVRNPQHVPALEVRKRELERTLRISTAQHGPDVLRADPRIRVYADYYRNHGKTYHVKAQWESVAVEGKPIPHCAALVEAMFMAELKNLILTAGHDLTAVARPVRVDVTRENDTYVLMRGDEQLLRAEDMAMVDARGILSSVLYGPDHRTRITSETREVLFAAMRPPELASPLWESISKTFATTFCSSRRTQRQRCLRRCSLPEMTAARSNEPVQRLSLRERKRDRLEQNGPTAKVHVWKASLIRRREPVRRAPPEAVSAS